MCRMFAAIGKDEVKAQWVKPCEDLAVRGKTRSDMPEPGHHDGWGVAAYGKQGKPIYLGREPRSVTRDLDVFHQAAAEAQNSKSKVAMVHFRKISVGAPQISNTHPFLHQEWSFCHNGTIYDSDKIPLKNLKPGGGTDSERFFFYLMEHMDSKRPEESLREAIREIKNGFKYTSLTFLLSDGKSIYAYRDSAPEFQDYYTLYTTEADGGQMVSSEPLHQIAPRWKALPNETLVALNAK